MGEIDIGLLSLVNEEHDEGLITLVADTQANIAGPLLTFLWHWVIN